VFCSEGVDALNSGKLHLLTYQDLAENSVVEGTLLYKIRPKHHAFDHVLETMKTSSLNPGKLTTMGDEDFLGKLKRIGQKCHGASIMLRSLQRYLLQLALRFEVRRRRQTWR
jgi:hypothetical protein